MLGPDYKRLKKVRSHAGSKVKYAAKGRCVMYRTWRVTDSCSMFRIYTSVAIVRVKTQDDQVVIDVQEFVLSHQNASASSSQALREIRLFADKALEAVLGTTYGPTEAKLWKNTIDACVHWRTRNKRMKAMLDNMTRGPETGTTGTSTGSTRKENGFDNIFGDHISVVQAKEREAELRRNEAEAERRRKAKAAGADDYSKGLREDLAKSLASGGTVLQSLYAFLKEHPMDQGSRDCSLHSQVRIHTHTHTHIHTHTHTHTHIHTPHSAHGHSGGCSGEWALPLLR